jgi:hypothetical protein
MKFQNEIKTNTKFVDENGILVRKKSEIIDRIIEKMKGREGTWGALRLELLMLLWTFLILTTTSFFSSVGYYTTIRA